MGALRDWWNKLTSNIEGKKTAKKLERSSAKYLYLSTRYDKPEMDDEARLKLLLDKQDIFNSNKSSINGATSATMEIKEEDLFYLIPKVVEYYKKQGMFVIHLGDQDPVAEGHIFLLWNAKQIKKNTTESIENQPSQKKIINE